MATNFNKNIPRNATPIVIFGNLQFALEDPTMTDPYEIKTFVNGGVGFEGWDQEIMLEGSTVANNVTRKSLSDLVGVRNFNMADGSGNVNGLSIQVLLDVNGLGVDSLLPEGSIAYLKYARHRLNGTGQEIKMDLGFAIWVPIERRGEFTVGEQNVPA